MKLTLTLAAFGIIGGADGPTSVFLAGKIGKGCIIGAVIAGMVLIGAGILLYKRFKRK